MNHNNDWLSEREQIEIKRRMFNDLQNTVANMSDRENLFIKILGGIIFAAAAFMIAALFVTIGVEALSGLH